MDKNLTPAAGTANEQQQASAPHWPAGPPKWKMAILSWLAIFPTLTTFLLITSPFLVQVHLVWRIFLNTLLIAPLMTWIIMPTMTRLFRPWLYPASPSID